jgi:small-conductance mechanosensitive channel
MSEPLGANELIAAALALAAMLLLSRFGKRLLEGLAERSRSRRIFIKNLVPLLNLAIFLGGGALVIFGILRIDPQNLLAFGLSAGVAIGFAFQDILANMFGGLVIMFTRPFNSGDKIQVGEFYGEVSEVSLLRVRIVTADDSTINIPAKLFISEKVSNANSGALDCQVVTEFSLPGDFDPALARRIAIEAAISHPYTLLGKPVAANVKDAYANASIIKVRLKSYVKDHRLEFRYSSELYLRVKAYLAEQGLVPPSFYRAPGAD